MPTMDGLMATKRIRSIEAASTQHTTSAAEPCGSSSSASTTEQSAVLTYVPGKRVPIVGVSASSSADQLKSDALQGVQLDLATGESELVSSEQSCHLHTSRVQPHMMGGLSEKGCVLLTSCIPSRGY